MRSHRRERQVVARPVRLARSGPVPRQVDFAERVRGVDALVTVSGYQNKSIARNGRLDSDVRVEAHRCQQHRVRATWVATVLSLIWSLVATHQQDRQTPGR